MIDELYDLIGGRQTVGAATESFYRRVFEDAFLKEPIWRTCPLGRLMIHLDTLEKERHMS